MLKFWNVFLNNLTEFSAFYEVPVSSMLSVVEFQKWKTSSIVKKWPKPSNFFRPVNNGLYSYVYKQGPIVF